MKSATSSRFGGVAAAVARYAGECRDSPRAPAAEDLLRPAPRPRQPLRRGDVGALLLLRHAGHPADLPVLLRRRRRPRHGRGDRERHRRRVRRSGLPLHDPRRLAGRPGPRLRAHAVLQRADDHGRSRRAGPPARVHRGRRGPAPRRRGQRRAEGERHLARGVAVRRGRRAPRRRLLAVLPRHQPRGPGRTAPDRSGPEGARLPLRLRPRRDRHGRRSGPVHAGPQEPSGPRQRAAEPAAGAPPYDGPGPRPHRRGRPRGPRVARRARPRRTSPTWSSAPPSWPRSPTSW